MAASEVAVVLPVEPYCVTVSGMVAVRLCCSRLNWARLLEPFSPTHRILPSLVSAITLGSLPTVTGVPTEAVSGLMATTELPVTVVEALGTEA